MIDFVFGAKQNPKAIDLLVKSLKDLDLNGSLYIGYPIFDLDDESLLTDALLITKEHGVIAFDIKTAHETDAEHIIEYQDNIYRGLYKKFISEKSLVHKRNLTFQINVLSFRVEDDENLDDVEYTTPDNIIEDISRFESISEDQYKIISASIQKTNVIKPFKKRSSVTREDSFGGVIKAIEKEIANLDKWQKKAAIESPEKPQRIRGLAGCGKTIILAMKAAYLHACNPTSVIVVTFQSRTLYQQFERLISKFYFEHKKDEPDWSFLRIRHAWGSNRDIGVYSEICSDLNIEPYSFLRAEAKFGRSKSFEGVCQEALEIANTQTIVPKFDYLLIDEAQDFPTSFYKLVYKFVKIPKRIVWAYDELQNLGDYIMLPPDQLFGKDTHGGGLVTLVNDDGKPQQDIMLPMCYRNPPWTLTLALALGLGIYRTDGLVRMFSNPDIWTDIGYDIDGGELRLGQPVTLTRSIDRTPEYFHKYINPETAIICQTFRGRSSQASWVAQQIHRNITEDELEPSDILVIFPEPYTMASDSADLMYELRQLSINCHQVGKDTSRDIIFLDNSIAITHIHRAKGNEAPMVYVMNSNWYFSGYDLGRKRNSLFTAITRTKSWVRITGFGSNMENLEKEINQVFSQNFLLKFIYPTADELQELEKAYRDKSDADHQENLELFQKIKKLRKQIRNKEITIDDIPDDIRDLFEE